MEELKKLIEELKRSAEVCEAMALDTMDRPMKSHFYGVGMGYRIAADRIESLVALSSVPTRLRYWEIAKRI